MVMVNDWIWVLTDGASDPIELREITIIISARALSLECLDGYGFLVLREFPRKKIVFFLHFYGEVCIRGLFMNYVVIFLGFSEPPSPPIEANSKWAK